MLISGLKIINTPIMGLQTGTRLAVAKYPIIDPSNLKIMAYEVEGPLLAERPSLIRIADIREFSKIGMIIDSNDELIGVEDVIKIKKIYDLNFNLIGLNVIDGTGKKLGKVEDYTVDVNSFFIQQIKVKPNIIKSLTDTGLLIHRSQITEINNKSIIVKSTLKKLEPVKDGSDLSYINPFRTAPSQAEASSVN